jgi:predicted ATP-grasp superfamily ATP-dependent carboligase
MATAPEARRAALVLRLYHGGLGVVRSLGRLGVRVYGVHGSTDAPAARSRYCRGVWTWDLDGAAAQDSIEFLRGLGRKLDRPVLYTMDDPTAMLVADHADELSEAFLFPAQAAGLAQALSSKKEMVELCRRHGVATAATSFPSSREDVVAFADQTQFPVVVKGIDSARLERTAGIRTLIVGSREELIRRYDELETPDEPNLMLQEYIPGRPEDVWMFNGYFDSESRCLFGLTGRKLRQYPAYTGITSLGTLAPNADVERTTKEFMAALGYRGILDIGYRFDARDGEYKLLDVNPRIGTTFRLFVDGAGMDVARAMYLDLTGQPVQAGSAPNGRRWLLEDYDLVSSIRYMRDRRLDLPRWLRSFQGVEELAWYARDDLAPFRAAMLSWLREPRRRRAAAKRRAG